MGKQIQILMSHVDEMDFLTFLRSTGEVQIFESFAPTADMLWVDQFNPIYVGHHTYTIWNKAFQWEPEYGTVGPKAHDQNHVGWHFISNLSSAPILEFTRSDTVANRTGRIYWSKYFSAPNGLAYDEQSFSKWVDAVWGWVRKHGKKLRELQSQPYALQDALRQRGA